MPEGDARRTHTARCATNEASANVASASFVSRQARARAWLILAGLSAMFAVSLLWRPPDEPLFIICPFRVFTGLPCPGCGMTRAFCAIGHGEVWRAINFNALSPALFLAAIAMWTSAAATLLNFNRVRESLSRLRPNALDTKILFALVFVWWAARLVGGF